jgi:hypothetical protein
MVIILLTTHLQETVSSAYNPSGSTNRDRIVITFITVSRAVAHRG